MLRPRVIPCLLIHEGGLVKTVGFRNPKYVGDPINAVKIFNEKECDELIVLDIDATVMDTEPDYRTIGHLAAECRMPLCYGGGVRRAGEAKKIIGMGVEKVALSAAAVERPELIAEIADAVGRQSVVMVIDFKKRGFGRGYEVWTHNATRRTRLDPFELAAKAAALGAGEIVLNSIDLDGKMLGYDLDAASILRGSVNVPVSILGGAGSLKDIESLVKTCGVLGAAAGSMFVFKGAYRAVLISYPDQKRREEIARQASLEFVDASRR
jgi:cyclase